MIVVSEFGMSLNLSSGNSESAEYGTDISTLLHGNNSELIFFINPDEESLFFVMENTSASWPVSVETTGFQESISFLEKEVVGDQLSLLFLSHGS